MNKRPLLPFWLSASCTVLNNRPTTAVANSVAASPWRDPRCIQVAKTTSNTNHTIENAANRWVTDSPNSAMPLCGDYRGEHQRRDRHQVNIAFHLKLLANSGRGKSHPDVTSSFLGPAEIYRAQAGDFAGSVTAPSQLQKPIGIGL